MLPLNEGCVSCLHRDSCTESRWNEARHPDALPPTTEPEDISFAHTCKTCGDKVLTLLGEGAPKMVIGDDCPRWDAMHGCATDCQGCRQERDALKRLHPKYKERTLAARAMMAVISKKKEDEVGYMRDRHDIGEAMVAAMMPGACLSDPGVARRADELAREVLGDFTRRCASTWHRLDPNPRMCLQVEAVEWFYLALQRHQEADAIVHEFLLNLTDTPLGMGWARLSLSERKLALRVWSGIVRAAL